MKTLLITGAAGELGTFLRAELAGRYRLCLADRRPLPEGAPALRPGERFESCDISRLEDVLRVTQGVDAIVHLAGQSLESDWDTILQANIVGSYHVFEAARRNGVKRVVYASSNHATGFYLRSERIDHKAGPRPDSRYGLSKAFGEGLSSLYADKYGLQVMCIRIGKVALQPTDERRMATWISPRDFAQLVGIGLEHPKLRHELVYGISGNTRAWYDNGNARRLGYRPLDNAESWVGELPASPTEGDPVAEQFQGGLFCVSEEIRPEHASPAPPPRRRA